jgi:hypothetical protein
VAQVFIRNPGRPKAALRFRSAWWIDALVFIAFIGLAYGLVGAASRWARPLTPSQHIDLSPWSLPQYAGLSTMRMAAAYVLSLIFSVAYARIAVANGRSTTVPFQEKFRHPASCRELFWRSLVMRKVKRLLVLIALLLTACGTVQGPQSHGGPVQDQVSLIDALRSKNVTVDISGTVSQPFLSPQSGTTVRLSGGPMTGAAELQLFEYGSASAASADANRISPDGGGTATTKISWVAPPHFFLKGRVMAVYVGSDSAVLSLLQSLLGAQFAGR